jgi:competence protein ComEC
MKKLFQLLTSIALIITLAGCTHTTTTPVVTPGVNTLTVHYLDVGQGDSEILQCGGQTMLIDAGTNDSTNTLIQDIKGLSITRFDIVVATHPHEDHIGGMDAVVKQFSIGTVYMPDVTTATVTFSDFLKALQNKNITPVHPAPGLVFNLGKAQCTVLAPNSATYADLNNYSIVIRVVYGNNSFLFTGDAQTQSEKEMLAKGYNLQADVLKVGHHGSDTATSPAFLAAVKPKYAVIEVGAGNDYGHPHQVTLNKLAAANIKVYRTDLNGTVTIISDGTNLNISTVK